MRIGNTLKYIVFESGIVGESIVLFPMHIQHSVVALGLPGKVVSAGFVDTLPESRTLHCYGESVTLEVKTRSVVDSKLATRTFFGAEDSPSLRTE